MTIDKLIAELERLRDMDFILKDGTNLCAHVTAAYEDGQWRNIAGVAINDTR